jgi:hypothetical protein
VVKARDAAGALRGAGAVVCIAVAAACGAADASDEGGVAESGSGGSGGRMSGGTGGATGGRGGSSGGNAGTAGGSAATGAVGPPAVTCDAVFAVSEDGFVRAPAAGGGCWHGYASAGGDPGSMVTPTTFDSCGMDCMLRVRGRVGPAIASSYVYLGFNIDQAVGSSSKKTLVPAGTGLAVRYMNTGASPIVRVQISSGTASSTRWCAPLTSASATIPYAMFNTECWEGGRGTAYDKEPIDTVQIVIVGVMEPAPFDVTLMSVQDT